MLHKRLLGSKMTEFIINFRDNETLPERIAAKAASLDLTPEQLIKRFVLDGMRSSEPKPVVTGENLSDFFQKNGTTR